MEKKKKLTNIEKKLLIYPPTKKTWICNNCNDYVPGKYNICTFCGEEKTRGTKLLWPKYLKVCEKAGIEPTGKSFRI